MQILLASSQILLQSTTARHTQWQGAKVLVYLEQDRISKFKRFKFQFEKLRQALLSICILCSFWDSSLFARMTLIYSLLWTPQRRGAALTIPPSMTRLCFTQAAMPRSPHESRFMSKPNNLLLSNHLQDGVLCDSKTIHSSWDHLLCIVAAISNHVYHIR